MNSSWDESVAVLEEALRAVASGANLMFEGWVRAELASALLARGDLDRADSESQTAVEVARAQYNKANRGILRTEASRRELRDLELFRDVETKEGDSKLFWSIFKNVRNSIVDRKAPPPVVLGANGFGRHDEWCRDHRSRSRSGKKLTPIFSTRVLHWVNPYCFDSFMRQSIEFTDTTVKCNRLMRFVCAKIMIV